MPRMRAVYHKGRSQQLSSNGESGGNKIEIKITASARKVFSTSTTDHHAIPIHSGESLKSGVSSSLVAVVVN